MLEREARQELPMLQDEEARKQNDVWALGRVLSATALSATAGASCHEEERLLLGSVAADAAAVKLPRIPLHEVVSRLSLTSA